MILCQQIGREVWSSAFRVYALQANTLFIDMRAALSSPPSARAKWQDVPGRDQTPRPVA
jgi:hypothetical protein